MRTDDLRRLWGWTLLCIAGLMLADVVRADIIPIDAFTDPFESEEFVEFYSRDLASSAYTQAGLEVGWLFPSDGKTLGNYVAVPTLRTSEAQTQTGLAGVLGGERYGSLSSDLLSFSTASASIDAGQLSFGSELGTQSVLELVYGGDSGLNMDFTTAADDGRFELDLLAGGVSESDRIWNSRQSVPMAVSVTSGLGTANERTATLTSYLMKEQTYAFKFAGFTGVDFSDVDTITLRLDQSDSWLAATDVTIGPFSAVTESNFIIPEPGTVMVLLFAGVFGVLRGPRWLD